MTKRIILLCISISFIGVSLSKGTDDPEAGRKAEQRSCLPCHSLRLIEGQRLSASAWKKEVDKMLNWGAVVPDRDLLVDYLAQHYSNTQPPPNPVLSADSK